MSRETKRKYWKIRIETAGNKQGNTEREDKK